MAEKTESSEDELALRIQTDADAGHVVLTFGEYLLELTPDQARDLAAQLCLRAAELDNGGLLT
jgi:hypothetical protein